MIREITETIASTIKENVKTVPKTNVIADEPSPDKKRALPNIAVFSPDFTVEEFGVAGSEPERKEVREEKFSGDGKATEFTLGQKALRPLLTVEHPIGEGRREPDDYYVDYAGAKVTFRIAPAKGKANVIVRYHGAQSAGEVRSLQLDLKYLVKVSAQDNSQRDEITVDVLRALVFAREALERQGVIFKILGGRSDTVDHETVGRGEVASKNIECIAQTKLLVEMPVGVMEKIIIEKRDQTTPV